MSQGYFGFKDINGDGRISREEFQASRDPRSGASYPLSPHFKDQGLSMVCADPELRAMLHDIEKSRFDMIQSGRTLTGRDMVDDAEKTIGLYRKFADKIEKNDIPGLSGLSEQERKARATEFRQLSHDLTQDAYDTETGTRRTSLDDLARFYNGPAREELQSFPGGVEYAPPQECLVGNNSLDNQGPHKKLSGIAPTLGMG